MIYLIIKSIFQAAREYIGGKILRPVYLVWTARKEKGQSEREKRSRSYFLFPVVESAQQASQKLCVVGFVMIGQAFIPGVLRMVRIDTGGCFGCISFVLSVLGLLPLVIGVVSWILARALVAFLGPQASEQELDSWLREAVLEDIRDQSMVRLGLDCKEKNLLHEFNIYSAIYWDVHGVPSKDVLWRRGSDGAGRFSIYRINWIYLREDIFCLYACDYNLIKDVSLNDESHECYYKDITVLSTCEIASSYTLPEAKKLISVQTMSLSVYGCDTITVRCGSRELREFLELDYAPSTDTERAIATTRKMIEGLNDVEP